MSIGNASGGSVVLGRTTPSERTRGPHGCAVATDRTLAAEAAATSRRASSRTRYPAALSRARPVIAGSGSGPGRGPYTGSSGMSWPPPADTTSASASSTPPSRGRKRGRAVGLAHKGKGTSIMTIADGAGLPLAVSAASAAPAQHDAGRAPTPPVQSALEDRAAHCWLQNLRAWSAGASVTWRTSSPSYSSAALSSGFAGLWVDFYLSVYSMVETTRTILAI